MVPQCGMACGSLVDYTVSSVSIKGLETMADGAMSELKKEAICWSRLLDEFFVQKNQQFAALNQFARFELPNMYYGDDGAGMMRKYPGQYTDTCGAYDPRIRPWYTAARTPAKDVVVLIDLSGSMCVHESVASAPFFSMLVPL